MGKGAAVISMGDRSTPPGTWMPSIITSDSPRHQSHPVGSAEQVNRTLSNKFPWTASAQSVILKIVSNHLQQNDAWQAHLQIQCIRSLEWLRDVHFTNKFGMPLIYHVLFTRFKPSSIRTHVYLFTKLLSCTNGIQCLDRCLRRHS